MFRHAALMSTSGWCPHSTEVTVSLLLFFQSASNNVGTACKALWDSVGLLRGAEAAKPDARPWRKLQNYTQLREDKLVRWGRMPVRELTLRVVDCGEIGYLTALMYLCILHEKT